LQLRAEVPEQTLQQRNTLLRLNVEAVAATHIGRVRTNNQDSFGMDADLGLYVVCDGMGGAAGGEIASQLAVDTFLAIARQELHSGASTVDALCRAVAAANRAVIARAQWDIRFRGMGSTLVAARIFYNYLTVINVGDSRAYLIRNGEPTQLTQDHSVVAERVRSGLMTSDEAERSSLQSVITRAIGADPDVYPDVYERTLESTDSLLLASDGLTRSVTPQEIASIIAGNSSSEACEQLIALANRHGGPDNITCIVIANA
jgi:serine/threonine protein phosphatase PrpC